MMLIDQFLKQFQVHPSWCDNLKNALSLLDDSFIDYLLGNELYLPRKHQLFNVFTQAKSNINYILLGESPYPRLASANGFAFWDAQVGEIWSEKGISKTVNRATSLRNFIKMLLRAEGYLFKGFDTADISAIPKSHLCQNLDDLFTKMLNQGFMLLNASLTWSSDKPVSWHAKNWYPFMNVLLRQLLDENPNILLLLFGKVAEKFKDIPCQKRIVAEHPYVLSFIENEDVLNFFQPLQLLQK